MILRKFKFLDSDSLDDYLAVFKENFENLRDVKKFEELYSELNKNSMINILDGKENLDVESLKVSGIIELKVKIDVPKIYMQCSQLESIMPTIEIVQSSGLLNFKSKNDIMALKGVNGLKEIVEKQPIPIICINPHLKLISTLNRRYLKGNLSDLKGYATIIGKIQNIIPKGKGKEVFSLIPSIEEFFNREDIRRVRKENKEFIYSIKGPALEILTLGIYI